MALTVTNRLGPDRSYSPGTVSTENVAISSAYVGLIPSSFPTSNLFVFNSGTHEAVIQVGLDEGYKVNLDDLKEKLRSNILRNYPEMRLSFEPIELTEKIMSQGSTTPVEVRVAGKDMADIERYADVLQQKMSAIPFLRDVQIQQPLKFPPITALPKGAV